MAINWTSYWVIASIIVIAIIYANVWSYMRNRSGEWHHHIFGWGKVTLVDGTPYRGPYVMRRRVAGAWEYRIPTRDEAIQEGRSSAW